MAWNDDDDGAGGDWRALDGKAPEAVRSDAWQRLDTSEDEDAGKQPWSRRTKLALVLAALAAVVTVAALVISWSRPHRPACILLAGARYDTNLLLPPNVLGWKGLQDIEEWAPPDAMGDRFLVWTPYKRMRRVGSLSQHELTQRKTWAELKESLPELRDGQFKEVTLVVFLSMFGATDANGAPVLYLDDPQGKSVLPVESLIDDLKAIQDKAGETQDSRRKTIVLLLDAVPVENHWPLGVFGNTFVEGLEAIAKDLPPDMYVMCSCAKGQRSWVSEEWRRSIFAHYVFMGLRGAADTAFDHKVSLEDLFNYVEAKVESWALGNRDTPQKPILLGNAAAAKNVDLVRLDTVMPEDAPDLAAGKDFDDLSPKLKTAWNNWQRLKEELAWTHEPHLWRQYQDALLRWEYLERSGSKERLPDLQALVDKITKAVESAPTLKFTEGCLSNSLAFAPAVGRPAGAQSTAAASRLWRLWELNGGDENILRVDKGWLEAQAAWTDAQKNEANPPAAYASLMSLPVDALVKEDRTPSRKDYRTAASFIKKFTDNDAVRPIEAHFLVMLDQGALPEAPPALLQNALRVRRLAEQTVLGLHQPDPKNPAVPSYCEFVFPLIRARLEQADKKRRDGEDLLLGAQAHWKDAEKLLTAAQEDYAGKHGIQQHARDLRDAMAARDRGWAELPYLAQWLGQFPVGVDPNKKVQGDKREREAGLTALDTGMDKLAILTRELGTLTEAPDEERLGKLKKLASGVQTTCDDLVGACVQMSVVPKVEADQLLYHRIDSVLHVPVIEGKSRAALIKQSRKITAKLNRETGEHKIDGERRQIDRVASGDVVKIAEKLYEPALALAGKEGLSSALAALPEQIKSKRDDSLKEEKLPEAKRIMRLPAELCRLIPGGRVAEAESETKPFTAPEGWRRLHAHELLLFLANRTYTDHWYKEDGKTPYYRQPALASAEAARKLAVGKAPLNLQEQKINEAREAPAQDRAKEIERPAALTVAALLNAVPWTTERSYQLKWTIGVQGDVPRGTPMAAVEGDPVRPRESREELAKLWPEGKPAQAVVFPHTLSEKPSATKRVQLHVAYRGQRLEKEVEVSPHPPNLTVRRLAPVHEPRVAVRMAKDLKYGALSIVLDTSGSMAWIHKEDGKIVNDQKDGDPDKRNRRIDYAIKALHDVLGNMPELEHLSLVRFVDSKPDVLLTAKSLWHPEKELEDLMRRLYRLADERNKKDKSFVWVSGGSPIVRAIETAMKEGFPTYYDGPKVVLVLSDGADTASFDGPGALDAKRYTKPELVQELLFDKLRKDFPGVTVMTVSFLQPDDTNEEFVKAKAQFEERPPRSGRIFQPVADGSTLGTAIRALLRPRLQLTAQNVGKDKEEFRDLDIYRWGDQIEWTPLTVEAAYRAGVIGTGINFGSFTFLRGQNMLLTLQRSGKFVLGRGLIAHQDETLTRLSGETNKMSKPDKDWVATLYGSERYRGELKQLLLLEKVPDKPTPVTQPRPEMVWLDVAPADKDGASWGPVEWEDDWTGAAPAYSLLAKQWAATRPAKLSAYWQEEFPVPTDDGRICKRLTANDTAQTIKVGKTWLEIESIALEPIPGQQGASLVVRIRHDPQNPVWLRLERWGGKNQGAEYAGGWRADQQHEYYSSVGKYTARFYPWQDFDFTRAEFRVVCVNSFKDDHAVRRHADFEPVRDYPIPTGDFFHGPRIIGTSRP